MPAANTREEGGGFQSAVGGVLCILPKVAAAYLIGLLLNKFWGTHIPEWTPWIGSYRVPQELFLLAVVLAWSVGERVAAHMRPPGENWRLFDKIAAFLVFAFFVATFVNGVLFGASVDALVLLGILLVVATVDLVFNERHRQKNGNEASGASAVVDGDRGIPGAQGAVFEAGAFRGANVILVAEGGSASLRRFVSDDDLQPVEVVSGRSGERA